MDQRDDEEDQRGDEEEQLRAVALRNAQSILVARQRAEEDLIAAKEALERKTRELAHSLAKTRATLEATTDGIMITNRDGQVMGFNENFVRMWGISRALMDTLDHRQLVSVLDRNFDDPRRYRARIEEIYDSSPPESFDLQELTDGRVFEQFSRIQYVEERNVGRVWSLRDITAHRRAEEALAKQSEQLRVTLASIGDAVIATDTHGCISFLNEMAESMTGWKQGEAAGQALETVFHIINETTRKPVDNPAMRALRDGVVVGLANHTILIAKDGAERPIDDSAAPIKDSQGIVIGAVLVFRDVTEQRRAEHDLQERATLSEFQAEIGLILTHAENVESMLSRCAEAIVRHLDGAFARVWMLNEKENVLELKASAGIYTHLDGPHGRISVGHDKIGLIAAERQPMSTNRLVGDARFSDQDWAKREGLEAFAGYPLLVESRLVGVVAMFARRELSEAAIQAIGSAASSIALAIEQKRQASELQAIAADLSEADRRKNEFLAMLAHELRNPLAPIRNALQIIQLSSGERETIRSASAMMERQIAHMVRLVDDLLDVSRISRGKIELRRERVDLASIIQHAIETSRPVIDSARQVLTVTLPEPPIYLNADPPRLAQVFGNLLNNSCRYSEPERHISLTAERRVGHVVVSVKDEGIGIPADMLPHVFEMFTQVDRSLERSQGGLGIGLTLVERLVKMHGGSVGAFSEGPGQGSEFVVRLPILEEAANPSPAPAVGQPSRCKARRILIVDDNRDSAISLATLLKVAGNETHTAHDGLAAVEAAAAIRPDVVLLDIGLPIFNGYEVARKIREQPWGESMMLVALTGWGQEEDRRKSREAGFDEHMVKPVAYSALMKLLGEAKSARP